MNTVFFNRKALLLPIVLWMLMGTGLPAQDKVVEKIQVVNREVVVRVFSGGDPVTGLTEKDFILYENGKRKSITSCRQLARALSTDVLPTKSPRRILPSSRPHRGGCSCFSSGGTRRATTGPAHGNILSKIFFVPETTSYSVMAQTFWNFVRRKRNRKSSRNSLPGIAEN